MKRMKTSPLPPPPLTEAAGGQAAPQAPRPVHGSSRAAHAPCAHPTRRALRALRPQPTWRNGPLPACAVIKRHEPHVMPSAGCDWL